MPARHMWHIPSQKAQVFLDNGRLRRHRVAFPEQTRILQNIILLCIPEMESTPKSCTSFGFHSTSQKLFRKIIQLKLWTVGTGCHSQGEYMNIRCCSAEIYRRCYSALVYNYERCCSAGIYKGDAGSGDPWEWQPLGVATPKQMLTFNEYVNCTD